MLAAGAAVLLLHSEFIITVTRMFVFVTEVALYSTGRDSALADAADQCCPRVFKPGLGSFACAAAVVGSRLLISAALYAVRVPSQHSR